MITDSEVTITEKAAWPDESTSTQSHAIAAVDEPAKPTGNKRRSRKAIDHEITPHFEQQDLILGHSANYTRSLFKLACFPSVARISA